MSVSRVTGLKADFRFRPEADIRQIESTTQPLGSGRSATLKKASVGIEEVT
jgi:hypothetical protein